MEVRSAGVRADANRRISEADLRWADIVFAMEHGHKHWIARRCEGVALPRIDVLEILDDFEFMDSELQEALRIMLDPEIDSVAGRSRLILVACRAECLQQGLLKPAGAPQEILRIRIGWKRSVAS